MTDYSTKTVAFKFTAEQLHFDFSTKKFVMVTKKTKRTFGGVSPKRAYRLLIATEAEKGSKVICVTSMEVITR